MDKAILVRGRLTEQMKCDGLALVLELERIGFSLHGAFWRLTKSQGDWKLVIVSPETAEHGPIFVYRKIRAVMLDVAPSLSLGFVELMGKSADEYLAVRSLLKPWPRFSTPIEIANQYVNGITIDEAYVYRISPRRKSATASRTRVTQ